MPPRQPKPTTVPEESIVEIEEAPTEAPIEEVEPIVQPAVEQKPFNRVLVFTSPVCGPCKQLKPYLAEINEKTPFDHEIISYDGTNKELFDQFGVRNVPVMIHVKTEYNGSELIETALDRLVGYPGKQAVEGKLKQWGYLA